MELSQIDRGKSLIEVAKATLFNLSKLLLELIGKAETKTKGKETLLGLTLILIGSQLYYYRKFTFWSRRGVKTPQPIPIFGNYLSYLRHNYQDLALEWRKKYGNVYGFYAGSSPYLVIADAKVLKQICIKDFDKFPNHRFLKVPNRYQKHFLINQKDDEWRSLRNLITPTFSSGKIKSMFRILNNCADDMIDWFNSRLTESGDNNGQTIVDIRAAAGALSMGAAVASFYGIKLTDGDANTPNSKQFFSRKSFETFKPSKLRFFISSILPVGFLKFIDFSEFGPSNHGFFFNTAKEIIKRRMKSDERQNDYLQLLLEAKADGANEEEIVESDKYEEHHALRGDQNNNNNNNNDLNGFKNGYRFSKKKLNEIELACQVVMLMIVATETTSCLMAHAIYLLAHHKDVQSKLREQLKSIRRKGDAGQRDQFDYEQLKTHPYLDCVMSESLRLMPPAPRMDREASENYVIPEYNIHVPKGTIVYLDYYAIHRNPDYWPEPDRFDPERFNAENKAKIVPGSYCPFGVGPRFCIGYRFGLTEAKLTVAKLISEFEFDLAPGAIYPPEPRKPMHVSNEFLNLHVSVKKVSSSSSSSSL